jgi:hypothetical protein
VFRPIFQEWHALSSIPSFVSRTSISYRSIWILYINHHKLNVHLLKWRLQNYSLPTHIRNKIFWPNDSSPPTLAEQSANKSTEPTDLQRQMVYELRQYLDSNDENYPMNIQPIHYALYTPVNLSQSLRCIGKLLAGDPRRICIINCVKSLKFCCINLLNLILFETIKKWNILLRNPFVFHSDNLFFLRFSRT